MGAEDGVIDVDAEDTCGGGGHIILCRCIGGDDNMGCLLILVKRLFTTLDDALLGT